MSARFVQRVIAAVAVFSCLHSAYGQDTGRPGFQGGARPSIPLGASLGTTIKSADAELLKELGRYSNLTDMEKLRWLVEQSNHQGRWPSHEDDAPYVVIVTVESTKDVESGGELNAAYFVAQESRLRVLSVLKGESVPEELQLYHFRYKRVDEGGSGTAAINGPGLLKLQMTPTPGLSEASGAPKYLAYLKKERNLKGKIGRVVPASGHKDAINAIFALFPAGDPLTP